MEEVTKLCDGFNKVFYCVNNCEMRFVDAQYHEDENWYVPDFLVRMVLPKQYDKAYVFSLYPQNSDRMSNFCRFYEKIDNTLRACVLMEICRSYDREPELNFDNCMY